MFKNKDSPILPLLYGKWVGDNQLLILEILMSWTSIWRFHCLGIFLFLINVLSFLFSLIPFDGLYQTFEMFSVQFQLIKNI